MAKRKCLGFGEFEGKCTAEHGRNPYWCDRCDGLRVGHISKRFEELGLRQITAASKRENDDCPACGHPWTEACPECQDRRDRGG